MKKFLILIYVVLTGVLMAATFIEHSLGTAFVERYIYHSVWFCCLWGILACFVVVAMARFNWLKRLPVVLLHSSFLIILGGAMLTFLFGEKGYIHLKKGAEVTTFIRESDKQEVSLPFVLRLDSFNIKYYPGTEAPSDYVSAVTYVQRGHSASANISMNRVLSVDGYRLYQSSYDDDGSGSWLSVNYDPMGIGVAYTGYVLLALASIGLLVSKRESFRRLLQNPLLRKGGLMLILLFVFGTTAHAELRTISLEEANTLCAKQVIYQDRIVPLNTLARDFVLKLTGKDAYRGLSPEQVLASWLVYTEDWAREPMIYVKNGALRQMLNHPRGKYIALNELFDGDKYKLQSMLSGEACKNDSKLKNAILELDEKVGLILMLREGTLIKPLPEDGSVTPLSETAVKAELLYNKIPFSKLLFMINLTLGILSFGGLLYLGLRREDAPVSNAVRVIKCGFVWLLFASCLFHWMGYALRWYIGGRMPLGNGYETMLFLAGCVLALSCWLQRRFLFVLPFGFLLSGFTLLVAYLGEINPQITPLMPVLLSPWLSIHVSLIMIAYALYAYIFLNGILALCLRHKPEQVERLMLFSKLMSYPATLFLGVGIFIGSVWANVSWGNYWSWDSKEVWALITFMIYGVAFHGASLPWMRKPMHYHIYMVLAFLSVLMTYVGVNFFLTGMHSYA